jgi:uncharacterized protein (DUF952 family)
MAIIFHIANREVWERNSPADYQPEQFATEGFIHCSTAEQLIPVANLRFRGQLGLVLLEIDTNLVKPEIRYENLEGGLKLFPHIYGQLERKAVLRVRNFAPGLDGFFTMPE